MLPSLRFRFKAFILLICMLSMVHFVTIVKFNTTTPALEIERTKHRVKPAGPVMKKHFRNTAKEASTSDILILSYMRSGSSFLGRVLGYRADTFYMYEPLLSLTKHQYFTDNDRMCDIFTGKCRNTRQVSTAVKTLAQIYGCTFYKQPAADIFNENINSKMSGPQWNKYTYCTKSKAPKGLCLKKMALKLCEKNKHKVTKVLRLSVNLSQQLMENNPNLKIVYLARDPRAIIHSHLHTTWSAIRKDKPETVEDGAKAICHRMKKDIQAATELMAKYPDRFIMVLYEEFIKPLRKLRDLNTFLNMSFSTDVLRFIKNSEEEFQQRTLLQMKNESLKKVNENNLTDSDTHEYHEKLLQEMVSKDNGIEQNKDKKFVLNKGSNVINDKDTNTALTIDNEINQIEDSDEKEYQTFENDYNNDGYEMDSEGYGEGITYNDRLRESENAIEMNNNITKDISEENERNIFTLETENTLMMRKLLESKSGKRKKRGYNPFTYRETLSWNFVKIIDKHCKDVYKLVGYKIFQKEHILRDMSIPSMDTV